MKNSNSNYLAYCLFALSVVACINEEQMQIENSIIGEWRAAEGQFLEITVNGLEKSLTEFGMEVLKFNESEAELAASEYLQNNFMGPIAIEEPKINFLPTKALSAQLLENSIDGTWEFINNGTVLNLSVNELPVRDFSFNVKKLTNKELELAWNWEMGLLEENSEFYEVGMNIQLVK